MIDFTKEPWAVPAIPPPPGSIPITLNTPKGRITFRSGNQAARALNVKPETIRQRRRRQEKNGKHGHMVRSLHRGGMPPIRIRFGDLEFTSQRDAARFFRVSDQTIGNAKRAGVWRGMEVQVVDEVDEGERS